MDFFGAQDRARRRTWQLAGLFGAAVTTLVVLTNLLVAAVYAWFMGLGQGNLSDPMIPLLRLPTEYWFWITVGVVGTVALACLHKYLWLRGGGRAIAEALGGRLINHATATLPERRLLNVVEEMAIAAGLPVPPVYVIAQPSINAFAAGLGFSDAVIGVNAGTLAHLDRDQLQGVIGHEFSHLLNGDSRLNLRLLALLHGILFIGLVGEGLLRGSGSRGRRNRGVGSGGAPVLVLGLGLVLIGYAGTLCGKLIKAAVNRQREFLADAAAVQFTRNPDGIAGALKKIGGLAAGSGMAGTAASEASHLFFGPIAPAWFGRLTATHPPLDARIRAVDPRWDGRYLPVQPPRLQDPQLLPSTDLVAEVPRSGDRARTTDPLPRADAVAAAVGRLDDDALQAAARLIEGLPADLVTCARDTWAARALLFALVLAGSGTVHATAARALADADDPPLGAETLRLAEIARALDEAERLVLVELAMPALKAMSLPQYRRFNATLAALIRLDREVDLFEWSLRRLLLRELRSHYHGTPPARVQRQRSLAHCAAAAGRLLSALAREGAHSATTLDGDTSTPAAAFHAGCVTAGIAAEFDVRPDPGFHRLDAALVQLQALPPLQKPRLIKACAATVLVDARATPREVALLQGIAVALDCPLPPSVGLVGRIE